MTRCEESIFRAGIGCVAKGMRESIHVRGVRIDRASAFGKLGRLVGLSFSEVDASEILQNNGDSGVIGAKFFFANAERSRQVAFGFREFAEVAFRNSETVEGGGDFG